MAQSKWAGTHQAPSKVAVGAPRITGSGVQTAQVPAQAWAMEVEEPMDAPSPAESTVLAPRLVEPEGEPADVSDAPASQPADALSTELAAPVATQSAVKSGPEVIPGLEALKVPPAPQDSQPDSPPVYVSGEHMQGYVSAEVRVEGKGQLIRGDLVVQGEELTYSRESEIATANQDVRINNAGNIFRGQQAQLHVPTSQGFFQQGTYHISATGAQGRGERIDFMSQDQMTVQQGSYSLCEPKADGSYDWVLTANSVDLDFEKDEGVAHGAVMRFKGVPILATPWLSFPLSDKRRSGLLVPTFSVDNDSGFVYEQPYYWNIAPNYDATLTPFVMSKRGVGMKAEFRYLRPGYSGVLTGTFLPNDRLRDGNNRWGYNLEHGQTLGQSLGVIGNARFDLKLNRASDNNYWQDFPRNSNSLTSRLLNNEGIINTNNGNGLTTLVRVQRWQTLQYTGAYITPPYDRTQVRVNYDLDDVHGLDFSTMGDVTKFKAEDQRGNNVDGTRSVLKLAASYPVREPGWFVVPKVQVISRHYALDSDVIVRRRKDYPWLSADETTRSRTINIPTFSLDAGLIFERKARLFNVDYVQTLEPRVFYTYTPYRNQSMLPLYDTGAYDYNLAAIYLENPYSGYDRIADVNMMTVGVGTRWQNPATGAEALSLNVAQRLRFEDQLVTLNNRPITSRYSDVLLSASTSLVTNWRLDALVQYDTDTKQSQRSLLMARWMPGQYRVMNLGYRMARGESEQVDLSWQWPIGSPWLGPDLPALSAKGGRWFTVGRVNYSLQDKKLVDGILGLEYQSCCWVARVAVERITTGRTEANTRLLFQLEFSGLARVGVNPLQRLKENIDRYEIIRSERIQRQNNFELYE